MSKAKKISVFISAVFFSMLTAGYISARIFSFAGNWIVPVEINSHVFRAEVVAKSEKMRRGLGERRGLCGSCGMLFEFQEPGKHLFHMKDMNFPLDIIWVSQGRVVHVEKNINPDFVGTLTPIASADAVLEINAGYADTLEIKIGDAVNF